MLPRDVTNDVTGLVSNALLPYEEVFCLQLFLLWHTLPTLPWRHVSLISLLVRNQSCNGHKNNQIVNLLQIKLTNSCPSSSTMDHQQLSLVPQTGASLAPLWGPKTPLLPRGTCVGPCGPPEAPPPHCLWAVHGPSMALDRERESGPHQGQHGHCGRC